MEHRYEQRLIKKDGSEAIMQLTTRLILVMANLSFSQYGS